MSVLTIMPHTQYSPGINIREVKPVYMAHPKTASSYTADASGLIDVNREEEMEKIMPQEMTDREKLEQFKKEWLGGRFWHDAQEVTDIVNMLLRVIDHADETAAFREKVYRAGVDSRIDLRKKLLSQSQINDNCAKALHEIEAIACEALGSPQDQPTTTVWQTRDAVKEMARRLRAQADPVQDKSDPIQNYIEDVAAGAFRSLTKETKPALTNNWIEKLHSDYEPPV